MIKHQTLHCRRSEFTIPSGVHYLNCAYMSPVSKRVERAGIDAVMRQRNPVDIPPEDYFRVPDNVRAAFAKLVNGHPRRVALLPSVSYAMAIATQHLDVGVGRNVIVVGDEFPSAVLPWRKLVRERGGGEGVLRTVTAPSDAQRGAALNDRLYTAIDRDTAVVVLPHVHWADGTKFDVVAIAARAREVGAAVVIDGTQSIGALPFDIALVRPDLLVTAGYKWLMGGYGVAVAHFGERFDYATPIEEVWTSQVGSENFAQLACYRDAYRADASRFDGGERAHFILGEMLYVAIEQLLEWDVDNVQRYCAALTAPWLDRCEEMGLHVEQERYRSSHLFGLRSRGGHDPALVSAVLKARNVHVSVRGDAIRVSPNLYNDETDLEALFDALMTSKFAQRLDNARKDCIFAT